LQGKTYRGNIRRNGVYKTKGVPKLNGLKWKFNLTGKTPGSPVIVDNVVYITGGKTFFAIDATTGKEKWKTNIGASSSTACIVDNVAYIGSKKSLYAVDIDSGKIIWKSKAYQGGMNTAPGYVYGLVFHKRIGLDPKTGKCKWAVKGKIKSPESGGPPSSVAISENELFVFGSKGTSLAQGIGGGGGWAGDNTPAISEGFVYAAGTGAGGGNEAANIGRRPLGDKAEKPSWKGHIGYDVPGSTRVVCFSSPAVWKDTVYVGAAHKKMTAFDAKTGSPGWRFEAKAGIASAPSISDQDGVIYFGSDDKNIYALNADSGKKLWEYKTGGKISSSPAIQDGVVYVSSQDGFLYAIN
jgi:outer membrane protein assembly factor BamB